MNNAGLTAWLLAGLTVGLLGACHEVQRACQADAECLSGRCLADGRCAPTESGDRDASGDGAGGDPTPGDDLGHGDRAAGDFGQGDAGSGDPGGDSLAICPANLDGVIARNELTFQPGLSANYRIARDVSFDTAGTLGNDGVRRWDLRPGFAGEVVEPRGFEALDDVWFTDPSEPSDAYFGATYATPVAGDDTLLGVYEANGTNLLMRGVVSREGGIGQTRLVYDPPVPVLTFPLQEGAVWSETSASGGWAVGVYSLYWESVDAQAEVDAVGELQTEVATFDVVRVRTTLVRTSGMLTTTVRSYAYVAECWGTVAWVLAHDDEPNAEFTAVAELGRIAP